MGKGGGSCDRPALAISGDGAVAMNLPQLYQAWAGNELGIPPVDIESVQFNSTIGDGSHDLNSDDFSTFAGSEIWRARVTLTNGTNESINLFDANPVNLLMYFAKERNITIQCEEPKPLTDGEKASAAISADIERY